MIMASQDLPIFYSKLARQDIGLNGVFDMKVIIINGPMGVGKSTVGKYIAENNVGTALIDGDWCLDIHPFIGKPNKK